MFWKKGRAEVEDMKQQVERDNRDKEAARLNFVRSLKRVARALEAVPIDSDLADLGGDLAGRRRRR